MGPQPEVIAGLRRVYEALSQGEQGAAMAAFEEFFRNWPDLAGHNPLVVRDYANLLAMAGGYERALALLQQGLEVWPGFVEFHVSRGQTLLAAGRRGEARQAFGDAVAADPAIRCQVYGLLLSLTRESGDFEALGKLIETCHRHHGEAVDCEFQMALAGASELFDYCVGNRVTTPATLGRLARACALFERLDGVERRALPAPLIQEAARLRDLHEFALGHVPSAASCRLDGPAFPDAALVMLIKDEGDIIYPNLRWHYRLGLRRYVIVNNGSGDDTVSRIRDFQAEFADAVVYLIDDPVPGHYQSRKITAAAQFARAMFGVDWILPLDADEVLTTGGIGLGQVLTDLARTGQDFLVVHRCDYCMTSSDDGGQPDPLVRLSHRQTSLTPTPKVLVRFREAMRIEDGNHAVLASDGRRLNGVSGLQRGVLIRHFPLRSRDQIRRKIVNGGLALEAAPELAPAVGDLWRQSYALYRREGEAFIERYLHWYYQCSELEPANLVFDPLP